MQVLHIPFSWSEYFYSMCKGRRRYEKLNDVIESFLKCDTGRKAVEEIGEKTVRELIARNWSY